MKKKILFIPNNDRDCSMFFKLTKRLHLLDIDVKYVSLDSLHIDDGIEKALKIYGFDYFSIDKFKTFNVLNILKSEQPQVIVLTDDYSFVEQAFLVAANFLEIPVVLIQNGARSVNSSFFLVLKKRLLRFKKMPLTYYERFKYLIFTLRGCDKYWFSVVILFLKNVIDGLLKEVPLGSRGCSKVLVTSEYDRLMLIGKGIPSERIKVTGNPLFSEIILEERFHNNSFYQETPKQIKNIVLFTSATVEHGLWTERMREIFIKSIIKQLDNCEFDFELTIKIHPKESIEIYKTIIKECITNLRVHLIKEADNYQLIKSSDLVLTYYSTLTIVALALNKPVFIINIFGEPEYLPYVSSGAAIGVYNIKNLLLEVIRLVSEQDALEKLEASRQAFLNHYRKNFDGKSVGRVINELYQLLQV